MTYPCGCSTIPKPSSIPSTDQAQVRGRLFLAAGKKTRMRKERGGKQERGEYYVDRNSISTM